MNTRVFTQLLTCGDSRESHRSEPQGQERLERSRYRINLSYFGSPCPALQQTAVLDFARSSAITPSQTGEVHRVLCGLFPIDRHHSYVAPVTKFIKDKISVKIADLKVGDRVVIHAKEPVEGKLVADTVEFATSKETQAAGAKRSTQ